MKQVCDRIKNNLLSASCVELDSVIVDSLAELGRILNVAQINIHLLEHGAHQYRWMRIEGKKEFPLFDDVNITDLEDRVLVNGKVQEEFTEDVIKYTFISADFIQRSINP